MKENLNLFGSGRKKRNLGEQKHSLSIKPLSLNHSFQEKNII